MSLSIFLRSLRSKQGQNLPKKMKRLVVLEPAEFIVHSDLKKFKVTCPPLINQEWTLHPSTKTVLSIHHPCSQTGPFVIPVIGGSRRGAPAHPRTWTGAGYKLMQL